MNFNNMLDEKCYRARTDPGEEISWTADRGGPVFLSQSKPSSQSNASTQNDTPPNVGSAVELDFLQPFVKQSKPEDRKVKVTATYTPSQEEETSEDSTEGTDTDANSLPPTVKENPREEEVSLTYLDFWIAETEESDDDVLIVRPTTAQPSDQGKKVIHWAKVVVKHSVPGELPLLLQSAGSQPVYFYGEQNDPNQLSEEPELKEVLEQPCANNQYFWVGTDAKGEGTATIQAQGNLGTGYKNAPEQKTLKLVPVEIAVDANRDGEITFDGKDKTTAEKPFRFWINDDRDIRHTVDIIFHFPGDQEEDDVNSDEQANPDCDVPGLKFLRDLEDLTRIWIDFAGINSVFPSSDSTVTLKVRIDADSGTPEVNLFQPVESEGGREFLKDEATGSKQLQGIYGQELCKVTGSSSVEVPRRAWDSLPDDKVVHLLFEGAKEGDGRLIFELWKDGQKLCDLPPIILRLRKANDFYETWTVGDVTSPEITDDNNNYSVWPDAIAKPEPKTGRDLVTPEEPEEKDYIMFVHGWNMAPNEKSQYADTMFKRLWHLGFKGRFGAYRWPTFYMLESIMPGVPVNLEINNFNGSEERAWNSAAALAALLQNRAAIFNVNGESRVRVFGHSMGNIVCSEALRTYGAVANAPVHTYISGQAALAAHCWDAINPSWMDFNYIIPKFPYVATHWSNTANIYRGYWQSVAGADAPHKWEADGRPSYMHSSYMPGNVKYVNHYNKDDWALKTWQLNQKLKPAIGYHYGWVPGSALGSEHRFYKNIVSPTTLLCPGDRFQIFSWASEARSFATGTEPLTRGMFSVRVDLKTDFGFDSKHKGHSAQFRSTVQKRWSYWNRFLKDNEIITITP